MPQDGGGLQVRRAVRSECPECRGSLAVMRVFGGKAQSEYWTLRCTRCGGIHLDIVKPQIESGCA
jgi:uncharacterized Zn finger protein